MQQLTITRPDDWHVHFRDGAMLQAVVPHTSAHFSRAIVMPNLVPPITTTAEAQAYQQRIHAAIPPGDDFTPLMTLYLTEATQADDVAYGFESGLISAVKLYPAGATTNSHQGVGDISAVSDVLERMQEIGMPLLMHGEVTDPSVDIFDREAVFIERVLEPLRARYPQLKMVMEHITTAEGVEYVCSQPHNLAATITTHHLIINRNHILVGGIKPHYYCLPVAKREQHRFRLLEAATSGDPRFFLGTDSAPHTTDTKENACGCAGIYTSINTLSCLAHVFEDAGALDKLDAFVALNGPRYYGLPINQTKITLVKQEAPVSYPTSIAVGEQTVTVFDPGFPLYWQVV